MHDTVVNQMLSKIDGVEALNNVLIIGTGPMHLSIVSSELFVATCAVVTAFMLVVCEQLGCCVNVSKLIVCDSWDAV